MLTIPFSFPLLSLSIFLPMIPLNVRKWLEPRLQASLSSLMMMIRATPMRRVEPIRMDPAKIPLISRFTTVIMSQVSQDQSAQGNFCGLLPSSAILIWRLALRMLGTYLASIRWDFDSAKNEWNA